MVIHLVCSVCADGVANRSPNSDGSYYKLFPGVRFVAPHGLGSQAHVCTILLEPRLASPVGNDSDRLCKRAEYL